MRTLVAIAALALITTSAQAKVHEIKLGGRTTRIEVPSNCKKISCIQVLRSEKASRSKRRGEAAAPVAAVAAPVAAAAATTAVAPPPAPVARTEPKLEPKVEPQAQSTPPAADERKSVARLSLPAQADQPRTVVAAVGNPSVADKPKAEPAKSAAPTPVGVWITEKKDGKIRIRAVRRGACAASPMASRTTRFSST